MKMMQMMKNKKGFTLVEVIVVLIIIAILAAVSIPALTGYIDDANEKAVVAEARTVVVASQTIASTMYSEKKVDSDIKAFIESDTGNGGKSGKEEIARLTGMTEANVGARSGVTVTAGQITNLVYTSGGKVVTYNGTTYEVANVTTP